MIKFKFTTSDELQEIYKKEIISRTKQRMADFILTIPAPHTEKFKQYFHDLKIEKNIKLRAWRTPALYR